MSWFWVGIFTGSVAGQRLCALNGGLVCEYITTTDSAFEVEYSVGECTLGVQILFNYLIN